MSALLAYLHSLSMMALAAMLFVQLLSIDGLHDRQQLERFVRYSFGLAAVAGVMLISGVGLLVWAERGVAFYLRNPVFYIKLAVFAAMLLIAITPARIILQWHREASTGKIPEQGMVFFVKRYLTAEAILLLIIPLAASLSARGIGLQPSSS
jgi:putative membrane protein